MLIDKYEDKVLAILRKAVDEAEDKKGRVKTQSPQIKKIIKIVENFIRKKKLLCYGGTAINNILPKQYQFYNKDVEIPDYDFYSPNALEDAKELANIYVENGYEDVEAKAGVHHGTFKVYVNFIPVADITQMDEDLFKNISKESIQINGIKYAPPNFLRMGMYLELSRPDGDVSRWEKVLKRLMLLNKNYPLINDNCNNIDFQRDCEDCKNNREKLYFTVRDSAIDQGLVFFGGYASSLYAKYMPKKKRRQIATIPDFDLLAEEPKKAAIIIQERLVDEGFTNIKIIQNPGVGEIISSHYEVVVNNETVCFIYKPIACHSYNIININGQQVKIATIDTMLSFYLSFIYADRPYYDNNRILCMAQYLFQVQFRNQLKQKGLLKRFSINCYGKQLTLEDIRADKAKKFQDLKKKQGTKEYEEYFLRYVPIMEKKNKKSFKNEKKRKTKRINYTPYSKKNRSTRRILNIEF